jgi:hypothetical protein
MWNKKKQQVAGGAMTSPAIITLSATSDDGFSDAVFPAAQLPSSLHAAGISSEAWNSFLQEANLSARYRWWPACLWYSLCCCIPFYCNHHNTSLQPIMRSLCDKWNRDMYLPRGFKVTYRLRTEKVIVHGHQRGATLVTYHDLIIHHATN